MEIFVLSFIFEQWTVDKMLKMKNLDFKFYQS